MDSDAPVPSDSTALPPPLSALAARVLGCLIEKELATPDVYPLTLNALVNACNQKNNRDPVMSLISRDVEIALEELRLQKLAVVFAGADARVAKYKQKIDAVYPMETSARAMMGELLLRGPQTSAGLRGNAGRMCAMPDLAEIETILGELAERPSGALVRKLPRQPGQKEARWVQLLTGEPEVTTTPSSEAPAAPLTVTMTLPPEVEARFAALEAEVSSLRAEVGRLKQALGES